MKKTLLLLASFAALSACTSVPQQDPEMAAIQAADRHIKAEQERDSIQAQKEANIIARMIEERIEMQKSMMAAAAWDSVNNAAKN